MIHKLQQKRRKLHRSARLGLYRLLRRWPRVANVYLRIRRLGKDFSAWWQNNNQRYGLWWRVGNGAAAILILVAAVIPVLQQLSNRNSYKLSAEALQLVGHTDPTLTKQLTFDAQTSTYQFNKDAIKTDDSTNPLAAMQAQVGTANGQGKNKSLYALDVPTDISKGVTYHDVNSDVSFSLIPNFKASAGKAVNGHLVFPMPGGNQAIYTLKNNGLKEDIVVPKATADTMTFSYHLNLPKTLAVKAIPNSNGAIGVYSGDPTLFGNISYGSSTDRANVEKAREKADKNYLVFGLPSPVIKNTKGNEVGSARFQLDGDNLSVVASGLAAVTGAVTIDPSVVVTSASDFQGGTSEDNIDFSTSGQIGRSGLTGGSLNGGWSAQTSFTIGRQGIGSAAYNGYLYVLGGYGGANFYHDVQYAPIGSDGTLGAWHYTHNSTDDGTTLVGGFTNNRQAPQVTVYNGYIYILGGYSGSTYYSDVQYAPLNSNGTVGTWVTTTSFTTGRYYFASDAYDGYMYVLGGISNGTKLNDVQYAPINADGTLGAWHYTHNSTDDGTSLVAGLSDARYGLSSVVYNGYIYILGGNGTAVHNDVQYAPLNSNGTVGTWVTTTSFTTGRYEPSASVYNGYMYLMGGTNALSTTQYAPINANGTLGVWSSGPNFTTGRQAFASAAYNGYVYILGGFSGSVYLKDTQVAKIDPIGILSSFTSTTSLSAPAITDAGCIAYNGYIYVVGGYNGSDYTSTVSRAPLATTGTIGAWTAVASGAGSLNTAAGDAGVAVYNGYMYVVGGYTTGTTPSSVVQYAPVNSDGSLGTWNTTTALANGIANHNTVAYDGYLYTLGLSGQSVSATVQYAQLSGSGGITGSWGTTSSLNTTRVGERMLANGGYMYVLGGSDGSAYTTSVEYAPINSNGTLGTWQATASMITARSFFGVEPIDGYMYALGGQTDSSTPTALTEYAPINSDGSLGTWVANTSLSMGTVTKGQMDYYNGYLYSVSGKVGGGRSSTSYFGTVNSGGTGVAGTWGTTTNLGSVLYGAESVAYNGYLYIAGGSSGSGDLASVQYAPINSNGTIGSWASTSSFITGRAFFGFVAYNGYMYIVGGGNDTQNPSTDIQYASINSDGTLGTWTTASGHLPLGKTYGATVVYNGYMYTMGGKSDDESQAGRVNTVYYAAISSTGTTGTWNTTTALPAGTSNMGAMAYGGYLYMVGGTSAAGGSGTATTSVYAAPITSNGTLGTWKTTTALPSPRAGLSVVASNGFMYAMGGGTDESSSTSVANTVYMAPITSSGNLGQWSTTSSFATARLDATGTIYNGYLYLSGGLHGASDTACNGSASNYCSDVQYTALTSMAHVARYSKIIDMGAAVNVTGITASSSASAAGAVSLQYRAAGTNGTFGSLGQASGISGSGCTGNLMNTRYMWVLVTLDDSYGMGAGGGFPDSNGSNASITDLTVNYATAHPNPNIRLRNGQTLQAGTLSTLDTCL